MKENELADEAEMIRRWRGDIDLYDPVAVHILASSEIAKAIIRKAGYIPEPAYSQKDKCIHDMLQRRKLNYGL